MRTSVCAGVVSVGLAVACQAQWVNQRLNDFAVTNELGKMIVLDDGGGYYQNNPQYSPDKAFDGNTGTFYDGPSQGPIWVGFGLQSPKMVTRVRYFGRATYFNRAVGTLVQGANASDFSDAETLLVINPPATWNPASWRDDYIPAPACLKSFTYVRFYNPILGSMGGNFGEIEFYGADPQAPGVGLPPVPSVTFQGCVNWRMNLFWQGVPSSAVLYEVERKIAHEAGFTPHTFAYAASSETQHTDMTLLLYQDTEYRIRAVNVDGESAWVTVTGLVHNAAAGQWIGTPGSWGNNGHTGNLAFDGNVASDVNGPTADGCWTGLDFGSAQEIIALRYVPRRAFAGRMTDGWFETADNPDFINPTVIYTIPSQPSTSVVTEYILPTPVTTRYARYCSPIIGVGDVAEVEFTLPPAPRPLNLQSVAVPDITNQHAVVTWSVADAGGIMSSALVYRATSAGGPYTLMTPDGIDLEDLQWTDTTTLPGIRYYYKVGSMLSADPTPLISAMSSLHLPATTYMRIERDWSDLSQVKSGMTLLGTHYTPHTDASGPWEIKRMFDDNFGTVPDTSGGNVINPAVGVDLGKPYHIQYARFAPRAGYEGRANGADMRGSNDPDYTNSFTRLGTLTGGANNRLTTVQTDSTEAYQFIFAQRPDAGAFYGNIAELELYGWDPDVANALFKAPASAALSIQPGGIRIDWADGLNQETYRVQRSPNGTDNWVDLTDEPGTTYTDPTPLIGQRGYYRILAVRGQAPGEETAASDTYSIVAYTPGNGTGLTASYYANYFPGYDPAEALAGQFLEPAPDWAPGNADPIRPGLPASTDNVRILWTGKLIVPFTGDYAFYASSDDGVAIAIDGVSCLNRWVSRGVATDTVTVRLTAGEHPLRVDYYNGTGGKAMKLEWGGALDRAVIPTSQLLPMPPPADEDVFVTTPPWQGRTFGNGRLGFHTLNPDGSVTVGSADTEMNGTNERYHYAWQPIHGDFIFEAKVTLDVDPARTSGKAMLMVRDSLTAGAPFLAPCTAPQYGYTVFGRLTQGATLSNLLPWTPAPYPPNPIYLKVKREKGIFHVSRRDPSSPAWETEVYPDAANAFGRDLTIGFAVAALVNNSASMFQTATFSEITIRKLNGTVLLLK